jgi:hypothetical protein
LGGIIVFCEGIVNEGLETQVKFKPGFVYVVSVQELEEKNIESNEGMIHGKIFKYLFGK